ncbi:caspase family protein [Accumulibacter sp.]|uniref:caspase family protein n=1 Tax=Accumulibacter sp. TaxID=2053492 RepID=UPI001AC121CE|nr:caspase family protein [Accumulibacter sp.]MBN8454528.1 caspase family protein [Accumulibacter sp.]MBO3705524.1 caspase family protein [Candidatus Accumulibacter conexus]
MSKRALCIGVNNYPGTHMDLNGCVNDANDWAGELATRGFTVSKLIDSQATKAAMVSGIQSLIGSAVSGDVVVMTFSGHGTYVPDLNGDEVDGLDEALCPYDLQTGGGALIDDEINTLFAARKAGVRLLLISDSCHSGTVTRAALADPDADDAPRPRFMPMGNWLPADQLPRGFSGQPLTTVQVTSGLSPFAGALSRMAGDLLLAGCKEGPNNFSYDARIGGRPCGAFTYYALKTLRALPAGATYADWHARITPANLPSASYPQTPQIFGSADARQRKVLT